MSQEPTGKNNNSILLAAALILVVGGAIFIFNPFKASDSGLAVLPNETLAQNSENTETTTEPTQIAPSSFAVRQRYFEEAFRPKRDEYNLFEKASAHLGIQIEEVPEFFSLNSESEIFSNLPKIPEDFSEIAYLLASGRYYAIGSLSEEYFRQPEFYPGFKEQGLKYWSAPDPKYWATNGYGTYPSEQFDTLSLSGRDEFTAVAFFYTGYGVQTYQGVTLIPTSESLKYFDVEMTPSTFLLEPVFPKFSENWAHQVTIKGKVKPGTPQGEYNVGFLIVSPPKDKVEEWEFKYRNLYFDAAGAIAPSDHPIELHITVTE